MAFTAVRWTFSSADTAGGGKWVFSRMGCFFVGNRDAGADGVEPGEADRSDECESVDADRSVQIERSGDEVWSLICCADVRWVLPIRDDQGVTDSPCSVSAGRVRISDLFFAAGQLLGTYGVCAVLPGCQRSLYRVADVLSIVCLAKRDPRRRFWSDADVPLCSSLRATHQRGQRAYSWIPTVVRGTGRGDGGDAEGRLVQEWFGFDQGRRPTGATASYARTGTVGQ